MKQHVLIYGCGNMASAFARGLKLVHPEWQFSCWTPSGTKAKALALELQGHWVEDLQKLPAGITAVVLGFKPQMLAEAAPAIKTLFAPSVSFVSLLVAVPITELQAQFPGRPILRLMANLAVGFRKGVVLWCEHGLSAQDKKTWDESLQGLGLAPQVSEPMMDVYTIPAASSPAFLFQWFKDAGDFARENGGDPQVAVDVYAQALRGTLEGMKVEHGQLDQKISQVASKGGVTQAVLDEWKLNFPTYIKQGFTAGLNRLKALKKS